MKSVYQQLTLSCLLLTVVELGMPSSVQAQSQSHYVIESAYFEVIRLPGKSGRGRIEVFESAESDAELCRGCGKRFTFDDSLKIQVAGYPNPFNLSDLPKLPKQLVYVEIEDGRVETLGFHEMVLSPEMPTGLEF